MGQGPSLPWRAVLTASCLRLPTSHFAFVLPTPLPEGFGIQPRRALRRENLLDVSQSLAEQGLEGSLRGNPGCRVFPVVWEEQR